VKQGLSSALRARNAAVLVLEVLLFANEFVGIFLLFAAVLLAPSHWNLGLGWTVAPLAALVIANTWALAWLVKAGYFIWLFGRWPLEQDPPDLNQAEGHNVLAAATAFDQGQFSKAAALLMRLPADRRSTGHWLALGRSSALCGELDESRVALKNAGIPWKIGRLMADRRAFGFNRGPYFDATMPGRIDHVPVFSLVVLVLVLGCAAMTGFFYSRLRGLESLAPSFDATAFQQETRGRLTLYYHDPDFRDHAAAVAQDALDHDLDFLGMPAGTFGPGTIKLYLCDSEAEYRRRSPNHPAWEAACADPPATAVYVYRLPDKDHIFFEVVLAHELAHLCYYRMAGASPDDWLNEGLADYLGYHFGLDRAGIPRQAWLQDHYFQGLRSKAMPFSSFFNTDPRLLPADDVATFYQQGFSVVYVLIEDYGREPFLKFLRECSDRKNVDTALASSFPTIPNIDALSAVWGLFFMRPLLAPPSPRPGTDSES